jgi:hypothetical protein
MVIECTGIKVDVSPFAGTYKAIKDVPIAPVRWLGMIQLQEKFIMYFGNRISHLLLWPNQPRAH